MQQSESVIKWHYYKRFQSCLWILIGTMLLLRGSGLLYFLDTHIPPNHSGFLTYLLSFNWNIMAIACVYFGLALTLGSIKGFFVLKPKIITIKNRPFFLLKALIKDATLILSMMLLGTSIRFLFPYSDVIGFILVAVGNALLIAGIFGIIIPLKSRRYL